MYNFVDIRLWNRNDMVIIIIILGYINWFINLYLYIGIYFVLINLINFSIFV